MPTVSNETNTDSAVVATVVIREFTSNWALAHFTVFRKSRTNSVNPPHQKTSHTNSESQLTKSS